MDRWLQWFAAAGEATIDRGSPVTSSSDVGGYSIVRAESSRELHTVLKGPPHLKVGAIEIYEFLAVPGT